MNEDINQVGRAISNICDHGEYEQTQAEIDGKRSLRRRIPDRQIDDDDSRKNQVLENSPRLPELDRISRVFPEV